MTEEALKRLVEGVRGGKYGRGDEFDVEAFIEDGDAEIEALREAKDSEGG
jgi:hypothetical protein